MIDQSKNPVAALLGKFHDLQPAMKKAESSADFEALKKPIEAICAEAEEVLLELESGRGKLVFSGEDGGALTGQIRQVEDLIKDLEGALAVAQERRARIALVEEDAACELRQGEAVKAFKRAAELTFAVYDTAAKLVDDLRALRDEEARFQAANDFLRAQGRGNMVIAGFFEILANKLQHPVSDPLRGVVIPGLYPDAGGGWPHFKKIIDLILINGPRSPIEPVTRAKLKAEAAAESKAA